MRTVTRGLVVAILLTISLPLLLSEAAISLIDRLGADYYLGPRLTMSGLVALAAIASSEIAFALVPASGSTARLRRVLHGLTLSGMSVLGVVALAAVDWSVPVVAPDFVDLSASWPFIVVGGIWFAAYLVLSLILRPASSGLDLPRSVRIRLLPDEEVLCRLQESRLMSPVTPDYLVATDQRLIVYRPTNLGITASTEHFNYIDIANIKEDRGWLFCSVTMQERYKDREMTFGYMPKRRAPEFVRVVQGEMKRRHASGALSQPPVTAPAAS